MTFGADADDTLRRRIGDDPGPFDDTLRQHIPWRRITPWRRIATTRCLTRHWPLMTHCVFGGRPMTAHPVTCAFCNYHEVLVVFLAFWTPMVCTKIRLWTLTLLIECSTAQYFFKQHHADIQAWQLYTRKPGEGLMETFAELFSAQELLKTRKFCQTLRRQYCRNRVVMCCYDLCLKLYPGKSTDIWLGKKINSKHIRHWPNQENSPKHGCWSTAYTQT